ncbi:hypothetical protein [Actinoplanes sp. NPDC026670]|uniref:hypothetical protein n=1 Tax=Actinoplanes sp. NPDC026670 TaxID=3154700 RepID=UPI0033DD2FA8
MELVLIVLAPAELIAVIIAGTLGSDQHDLRWKTHHARAMDTFDGGGSSRGDGRDVLWVGWPMVRFPVITHAVSGPAAPLSSAEPRR